MGTISSSCFFPGILSPGRRRCSRYRRACSWRRPRWASTPACSATSATSAPSSAAWSSPAPETASTCSPPPPSPPQVPSGISSITSPIPFSPCLPPPYIYLLIFFALSFSLFSS
uniref:Uncharacterized protein n=1 Tax=Ananas comosus var. bracteatus TaxID=296719 RepID=A0A6V7Q1H6_ANACO|nr:unnamed protein product [Ananas comosus var. bracteatus]